MSYKNSQNILYHRKNEIAVEYNLESKIKLLDIRFKGKFNGESMLPHDWVLMSNNNRIICMSFGNSDIELILEYVGKIDILSASVVFEDRSVKPFIISVEDYDYWELITSDFDKNTQYWEGLDSYHSLTPTINDTSIITKNLNSMSNQFFLKDGTEYIGKYHRYNDFQAFTGEEPSSDSIAIYQKKDNKIVDYRKKMTSTEYNRMINVVQKVIPKTRVTKTSQSKKVKLSMDAAYSKPVAGSSTMVKLSETVIKQPVKTKTGY
tara:strand:- start:7798 stop:8586 length:789 start_codon:yes stop_codon:yes gene_type:complete